MEEVENYINKLSVEEICEDESELSLEGIWKVFVLLVVENNIFDNKFV